MDFSPEQEVKIYFSTAQRLINEMQGVEASTLTQHIVELAAMIQREKHFQEKMKREK